MPIYVVRRPGIAATAAELDAALTRLRAFESQPDRRDARWLRSYALREADGRFGLACIFEANAADTLRRHAAETSVAAGEILPVAATLIVQPFAPAKVYLVRRRSHWQSAADLQQSAAIARRVGVEEMASEVSWLRTYAVHEDDGSLGTVCIYQGVDGQALSRHAERVGMPADEIFPVIGRVLFQPDPDSQPAASAAFTA
jgi:hypothetical protein